MQKILYLVEEQRIQEALQIGRSMTDPIARVLTQGLEHWPDTVTSGLDTTITLAPLLGIYGTITGMIRSFGFLSRAGLPDPQLVASGIAEALITTAAGLTITILSIPPYNFFSAKREEMAHDIERQATALEVLAKQRASDGIPEEVTR